MKTIEVYDPAMCCQTGVCGTDVDPKLAQFAGDLAWLQKQGATVRRFNLAQQPAAFAENSLVKQMLQTAGNDCLPLVIVDGTIATRSIYPTREQLAVLAGVAAESSGCCEEDSEQDGGCCCSGSDDEPCCS